MVAPLPESNRHVWGSMVSARGLVACAVSFAALLLAALWPGLGLGGTSSAQVGANTWVTLAPMLTPQVGLGAATANTGKVYAIGGLGGGLGGLDTTEEYDPTSNMWVARSAMPTSRGVLGVAAGANGRIYAIGG